MIEKTIISKKGMKFLLNGHSVSSAEAIINESKLKLARIANEIHKGYVFDDNNKIIFENVLYYFLGLEKEYDISKGIAMIGSFGTGKTTIFNIFHRFMCENIPHSGNGFRVISIEDVINDCNNDNFIDSINVLNKKTDERGRNIYDPRHILINEFGHDYNIKIYGTDVKEILDMLIMKRYDIYQQYGKVIHITSNYTPAKLKESLHPRLYDRFKEMFNIVPIHGISRRK